MKKREAIGSGIGARVRTAREAAGIAQRELARMAGMSAAYLNRLEADACMPSLEIAYRLTVALQLPFVSDLLGETADEIRADVESRRSSAIWRRTRRVDRLAEVLAENARLREQLAASVSAVSGGTIPGADDPIYRFRG